MADPEGKRERGKIGGGRGRPRHWRTGCSGHGGEAFAGLWLEGNRMFPRRTGTGCPSHGGVDLRLDAAALGRCAGHVATDQQEIYQEDGKIESGVRDDVMKKAGMACQGRYVRKS